LTPSGARPGPSRPLACSAALIRDGLKRPPSGSIAELHAEAWKALVKGLGAADALRYQILFEPGAGDYAAERDALFPEMSLDDWVATIRARENATR